MQPQPWVFLAVLCPCCSFYLLGPCELAVLSARVLPWALLVCILFLKHCLPEMGLEVDQEPLTAAPRYSWCTHSSMGWGRPAWGVVPWTLVDGKIHLPAQAEPAALGCERRERRGSGLLSSGVPPTLKQSGQPPTALLCVVLVVLFTPFICCCF